MRTMQGLYKGYIAIIPRLCRGYLRIVQGLGYGV